MTRSRRARLGLIHDCVVDLRNNGIDLSAADPRRIREVVRQHLDYFQMMLGGEPAAGEVISLIERDTHPGCRSIHGPDPLSN